MTSTPTEALQQRIDTLTRERDAVRELLNDALAAVSEQRARETPPSSEAEGLRELLDDAHRQLTESRAREARRREVLEEAYIYIGELRQEQTAEAAVAGASRAGEVLTRIEDVQADTSATEWLRGLLNEVAAAARNAGQNEADHLRAQRAPTNEALIDEVLRGGGL